MARRNATRAADALFRARRKVLGRLLPGGPPLGMARRGAMRRMRPVSEDWGFDRGKPVDRWYLEDFLNRFSRQPGYGAGDIQGRVIEIGGDDYARRFASGEGTTIDVLHVSAENPKATVVGDLVTGDGVPENAFDCVICTQTLHVLYDFHAAVGTLHRMLAPGRRRARHGPRHHPQLHPRPRLLGRLLAFHRTGCRADVLRGVRARPTCGWRPTATC